LLRCDHSKWASHATEMPPELRLLAFYLTFRVTGRIVTVTVGG
jgi:hypothetical protein